MYMPWPDTARIAKNVQKKKNLLYSSLIIDNVKETATQRVVKLLHKNLEGARTTNCYWISTKECFWISNR